MLNYFLAEAAAQPPGAGGAAVVFAVFMGCVIAVMGPALGRRIRKQRNTTVAAPARDTREWSDGLARPDAEPGSGRALPSPPEADNVEFRIPLTQGDY